MTRSGDEPAANSSQPCPKGQNHGRISTLEAAYDGYRLDQVDLRSTKTTLHYSEALIIFANVIVEEDKPPYSENTLQPEQLKSFYEEVILTDDQMMHYENEGDVFKTTKVALRILNEFVSHYRLETGYYFTPFVRMEDLLVVGILTAKYKPVYQDQGIYDVTFDKQMFSLFEGMRSRFPDISEEERKNILTRVQAGERVPIIDELILSANSHFEDGNYRQAIIDVETAFEVAINNTVEAQLQSQGLSHEEIDKKLSHGIKNSLKLYRKCPDVTPFQIGSKEYDAWKWAYGKRIRLAHYGATITDQEAWTAFSYFNHVFKYLFDKPSWIILDRPGIKLLANDENENQKS